MLVDLKDEVTMKEKNSSGNMIAIERRRRIYNCALEKGSVSVGDLAALFGVAENTIRNDLQALDKEGRLVRSYGGAVVKDPVRPAEPYSHTREANILQKSAIGASAAIYLPESGSVFINAGSTTRQLVSHIPKGSQIHVTTNSPEIALYLASEKGINVELLGGRIETESLETDGSLSESVMQNQYWDIAFIGVSALDLAHGITSISRQIATLENRIMTHSRSVIGLCDSSKFNRYSYAKAGDIDLLDILLSDSGISDQLKAEITEMGVEIVVADAQTEQGDAPTE